MFKKVTNVPKISCAAIANCVKREWFLIVFIVTKNEFANHCKLDGTSLKSVKGLVVIQV